MLSKHGLWELILLCRALAQISDGYALACAILGTDLSFRLHEPNSISLQYLIGVERPLNTLPVSYSVPYLVNECTNAGVSWSGLNSHVVLTGPTDLVSVSLGMSQRFVCLISLLYGFKLFKT